MTEKIINTLQQQVGLAKDMNHRNIILSVEEAEILIGLMRDTLEVLNNVPDKIVMCKDCRHWDEKKNECHNINSYMQYRPCFKDWFCADGERKNDDN